RGCPTGISGRPTGSSRPATRHRSGRVRAHPYVPLLRLGLDYATGGPRSLAGDVSVTNEAKSRRYEEARETMCLAVRVVCACGRRGWICELVARVVTWPPVPRQPSSSLSWVSRRRRLTVRRS